MTTISEDAHIIIQESIEAVLPERAVLKALQDRNVSGDITLVSIGKAAWKMANTASAFLGSRIKSGIVITKYNHSEGPIANCEIWEAGHPIPDENSVAATTKVLEVVAQLNKEDQILLLVSGGGSALFEKPAEGISLQDIADVTQQLLDSGANIAEINTIRKRLSAVKGGKFAQLCNEVKILAIVLSDVVGDQLDTIASGPAYPDSTTCAEAMKIVDHYKISINSRMLKAIQTETPKQITNCQSIITGNVTTLCEAAEIAAGKLGYLPEIISTTVSVEARKMGWEMASMVRSIKGESTIAESHKPRRAIIAGGETIVKIVGKGKGGRNQELALAAAIGIEGIDDVVIFSVGSDGTDGPTDAAGGIVDGTTAGKIRQKGQNPERMLDNNDSYHALKLADSLLITGPTGTNVNDLMVILMR